MTEKTQPSQFNSIKEWMKKRRKAIALATGSVVTAGAINGINRLPDTFSLNPPSGFKQEDYEPVLPWRHLKRFPQTIIKPANAQGEKSFLSRDDYDTVIVALGPEIFKNFDKEKFMAGLKARGVREVIVLGDGNSESFDAQKIIDAVETPKQGPTLLMIFGHGNDNQFEEDGKTKKHVMVNGKNSNGKYTGIDTSAFIEACHVVNLSPYPLDSVIYSCDSHVQTPPRGIPHMHGMVLYAAGDQKAYNTDEMRFLNTLAKSPFSLNRVGLLADYCATDHLDNGRLPILQVDATKGKGLDIEQHLQEAMGKPFSPSKRDRISELREVLGRVYDEYYTPWIVGGTRVPFYQFFDDTVAAIEKGTVSKEQRGLAGLIAFSTYITVLDAMIAVDEAVTDSQKAILEGKDPGVYPRHLPRQLRPLWEDHVKSFQLRLKAREQNDPAQPLR